MEILTGDTESLIAAAGRSLAKAMAAHGGGEKKTALLIDCISRALFLGEDFSRELSAVNRGEMPLIGVLSLGEIANSGEDYMELYNKTCVVGIMGD